MIDERPLQHGDTHSDAECEKMLEEMKFDIDGSFAKKINSIQIDKKDPWAKAINKACFPKWYTRFWQWVKGLFGYKPKNILINPAVEMNEYFDFQEWVISRRDKIIKAINSDGREKNTIICPICYKQREYYLATGSRHIHSHCKGCGISITQ